MSAHAAPSPDELRKRADGLVPLIAERAAWSEENRRLHEDVVDALAASGLLDLRRPVRYGGFETSTTTLVDLMSTLAQADGSTAWNAGVWSIGAWMAAMYPDHVQDEVFATPAVRICVVLSPTAVAAPVDGGLRVDGRWRFMSGARDSHWQVVIAMAPTPDGAGQWPVAALVPMKDLTIVDDWYTSGLAGSGSVSTVADGVFVPRDRVIPMMDVLQGRYPSRLNADSPVFRTPMIPTGAAGFVGVAVGMAKAAEAAFLERLPERKITFTDYAAAGEAPVTHLQIAQASLRIEESDYHAHRMAEFLDRKGESGEQWTLDDRMRNRGWLGRTVELAKEAVDQLAAESGGSSIYRTAAIQRIQRDLHAFSLHALMHPATNFELYGRGLCGLGPNTMYL